MRARNDDLLVQRESALAQLSVLVEEKKAMELDLFHKALSSHSRSFRLD